MIHAPLLDLARWQEQTLRVARDACTPWVERQLRLSSDISSTIDRVVGEAEERGFPSRNLFAIRLALEEALVNAIKHGHEGDANKSVRLRYTFPPEAILMEVTDQGPGFDPDLVVDPTADAALDRPGGRGLFLIKSYMTWVRHNDRGNSVMLCKRRSKGE